jgi:hypothetical protein
MLSRIAKISFAILVLATAAGAARAIEADQPPAPKDSKTADQAAPGQEAEHKAVDAAQLPAANARGMVVVVDPATGKIVKPTDAQIRTALPASRTENKPKAPLVMVQGAGGAVGVVLTPESFSYSVVNKTADDKIVMDCVTGDQTANRLAAGESARREAAPNAKVPLDEKKK